MARESLPKRKSLRPERKNADHAFQVAQAKALPVRDQAVNG